MLLGGLLVGLGCGYRLLGRGPVTGECLGEVYLAAVDDRGDEPLFGVRLARLTAREAAARASVRLVPEQRASCRLLVRVDTLTESPVAFSVAGTEEYLLEGRVTATLIASSGEVLWKATGIRAAREFSAGGDVNRTEASKEPALELLARDLAREVLHRLERFPTVQP